MDDWKSMYTRATQNKNNDGVVYKHKLHSPVFHKGSNWPPPMHVCTSYKIMKKSDLYQLTDLNHIVDGPCMYTYFSFYELSCENTYIFGKQSKTLNNPTTVQD